MPWKPLPPYLYSWSKTKICRKRSRFSIGAQNARKLPKRLMFTHFSSDSRDPRISLIKNHKRIQYFPQTLRWNPKLLVTEAKTVFVSFIILSHFFQFCSTKREGRGLWALRLSPSDSEVSLRQTNVFFVIFYILTPISGTSVKHLCFFDKRISVSASNT